MLWDVLCPSRPSLSLLLTCIVTAIAPLRRQLFGDPRFEEGQSPKGLWKPSGSFSFYRKRRLSVGQRIPRGTRGITVSMLGLASLPCPFTERQEPLWMVGAARLHMRRRGWQHKHQGRPSADAVAPGPAGTAFSSLPSPSLGQPSTPQEGQGWPGQMEEVLPRIALHFLKTGPPVHSVLLMSSSEWFWEVWGPPSRHPGLGPTGRFTTELGVGGTVRQWS